MSRLGRLFTSPFGTILSRDSPTIHPPAAIGSVDNGGNGRRRATLTALAPRLPTTRLTTSSARSCWEADMRKLALARERAARSHWRCWKRPYSIFLLCVYLSACSSWHVVTPSPAQYVQDERPSSVLVTRTDRSTLVLRSPTVREDSLTGTTTTGLARGDTARTVSLPLADVQSVAVRKFSVGKTALLVIVPIGALWLAACVESATSDGWIC